MRELSPRLYQRLVRPPGFTKRYVHDVIREYYSFENQVVLDFGAGIGSNCTLASSDKYIGLDPNPNRISRAIRLNPAYRFQVLFGTHLPVMDTSIDDILIVAVLHHIQPTELAGFLLEFRRVLRPTGQVIVLEPCLTNRLHPCNWFMTHFDKGKNIMTRDGYLSIFSENGYRTRVIREFKRMFLYNELFFVASPD